MGEELEGMVIPKAPSRAKNGLRSKADTEKRAIGIEMAAMAYVAMENGDYVFPPGVNRPTKAMNGIHQGELMRIAGYKWKIEAGREFPRTLGNKREFWQMVELYRIRRNDPMFRKEQENMLIGNILGDAMRLLAERLRYYPHTFTNREAIDVISKLVGATSHVTGDKPDLDTRAMDLLNKMPESQRNMALEGLKEKAKEDLANVEALQKAHAAADDGH
jgi:hypothetical protein